MSEQFNIRSIAKAITEVTKVEPCLHCGKPDWCYRLGDLSVCKRQSEPAEGWETTTKADKDGTPYYAPAQIKKAPRATGSKDYFYCDRAGNKLVRVTHRYAEGKKQGCPQARWDSSRRRYINGLTDEVKAQIPLYRYPQIWQAIERGETIFFVEGEGKAEALCELGLQATTAIGGAGKYRVYGDYKQDLEGANLVLCPDRDKPGLKHMEDVAKDFPDAQWLYAPPSDYFWEQIAESGGLDIKDWIDAGATAEDINAAVGEKIYSSEVPKVESDRPQNEIEKLDFTLPNVEEIFTQKAAAALFGDTKWICLNGHLHRWNGKHYALVPDSVVKSNIARWCASTPVWNSKREEYVYSYARSSFVENIWNWVSFAFAVDPGLVNPPGINCKNGTLKLHWEERKVTWHLHNHDPKDYYTYTSAISYDPNADGSQCDRLLACLNPEQQEILLKTLAAALDLASVRKYCSRIKAIFCQGNGNNGKDSIREAISYIFGALLTSATVSDFSSYDQGRKFTLAKLEGSSINWSSENSSFKNIDGLQSLKAAITGEPLDVERKNQDERPMSLNTIFLFNINELPSLQAGSEAIQSRWAVLSFDKTFKIGADASKGELEADARFRYDPQFLQLQVVPALLNKILDALPKLIDEGIDYSCTQKALETIQQKTNHLWGFANQVGLDYQPGGRVYINELWEKLKDWYIANGTLEIVKNNEGREKLEWHDQVSRFDKNVKGANQVYQRFSELFPKISRIRDSQSPDKKGQWYLLGVGFSEASEAVGEAVGEAATRSQSGGEAGEAVEHTLLQLLDQIQALEPLELRKIMLKIQNRSNVGQTASLASLVDIARAVASPTASPTASLASLEASEVMNNTQNASVYQSPVTISQEKSSENTNKISSDNNQSVFLPPASSTFKIGDKCRIIRQCYGIPQNKELTILKIEGAIATVMYKGCKSSNGVEIELDWLETLDQEAK